MNLSGLRSRWVKAGGVRTHYTEAGGDGPVILALHGGGHGSSGLSGMGALMAQLADDFRIVAPDSIGGYGLTDAAAPAPHGLISRADQARDVADALCLEKFTILGNSQGAFAATLYAMDNPERVERLVCIGSLTLGGAMGIEQAPTPALKALMSYDGTPEAMRRMLQGLVSDPSKITEELIARRQASATRPGAMEAMAQYTKITGGLAKHPILGMKMDMRVSLPRLTQTIPTIFIWGTEDTFALPATGHAIEALLPAAKFHWVPGGHQVQTDQPAAVANIIRKFILGA